MYSLRNNTCVFCGLKRQNRYQKYNGGIACHDCYQKHVQIKQENSKTKTKDPRVSKGLREFWQWKQYWKCKTKIPDTLSQDLDQTQCPAIILSASNSESHLLKAINGDIAKIERGVNVAKFG